MFKETPKKITSLQNPLVKHLVKLRTDGRYRQEQNSVLICGVKLVQELQEIVEPKARYNSENVSPEVMKKITGLVSPEGIAAEFPLPSPSIIENRAPLLVLDQINDPGNMGTLIRTALALGWEGVFFLPGCVDPFHEKVIRASRGALFRLPWKEGSWEELKSLPLTPYVADTNGRSLHDVKPSKNTLLLLSNEAQGLSEEGKAYGERITIPMSGKMESLNVATSGAIMMYELGGIAR